MGKNQKHILYSVLNWGLGHATRSIPIIRELLNMGVKVSLAGEGATLYLLQTTFPELPTYKLKGLDIRYPEKIPFAWYLLSQIPTLHKAIQHEHLAFQKLVSELNPDATISDNRYGAYAPGIPSVLICHQLQLKVPFFFGWLESPVYSSYKKLLLPFSQIWVPDSEGEENITGSLAHTDRALKELRPVFIGPLSRLKEITAATDQKAYDLLVILSGPEPQRSYFEKLLLKSLENTSRRTLMVSGKPIENQIRTNGNLTLVTHLNPEELKYHMIHSEYIVCRAGHSTMMDLCALRRTAVVIPTPGQTEQEYLSKRLAKMNHLVTFPQHNFNIEEGIQKLQTCKPIDIPVNEHFKEPLENFMMKL